MARYTVRTSNTGVRAMKLTKDIIYAAGRDAGNRSMKAAGRKSWNAEDWNAAADEYARLTELCADVERAYLETMPLERDLNVSRKTQRALQYVASGDSGYAAAKKAGISLSTIYRVLKMQREAKK